MMTYWIHFLCAVWQPYSFNGDDLSEELISVHFNRSDRELLGPSNQYLPRIVAVFAEVSCCIPLFGCNENCWFDILLSGCRQHPD